ncbi:gas vesicle synthesis family protein [Halovivax asiaticus JCM 14624]|uniref:Gas vesicle synthesis family protein n=1 Tax=Halovivax asiaticus JCM 14624 TaxID=1227490 RepID=M0BCV1_9EURY|nr:gas vesicle protein GvpO [Halovivax asiaticus]ELZ08645.1 gas vesicle synthesis family protein [Halovivax asiaticus JCM 14624]
MAQTATSDGQCIALTADGERCSRTAGSGDFCYQHDESDSTVSNAETASEDESSETDQSSGDAVDESELELDEIEVTAEEADEQIEGLLSIRQTVKSSAGDLVGHPFDGVSEITAAEEGWTAVVEVIERKAVPDTQDVIGRYRIDLDENGTVQGYRRLDRYRRGDTTAFDPVQ